MKKWINKNFTYIPLMLVELYLLITVFLYAFGPLDWKTENVGLFWTLLILYHVAFIGGYILSIKKVKLHKDNWSLAKLSPRAYSAVIWGIILLCAVYACIEYKNSTHASSYIPYELFRNFWIGLINPAQQYYGKFLQAGTSSKLVTAVSALISFIYISLIPLLVIEWKRLSKAQKACLFAIIIFKVLVYVSIGTNKGIFDTMFGFVGILLILVLLNLYHGNQEHIDKKTFIKVAAFTLCLVVFSFWYFTSNISSRVASPVDYALDVSQTETEPEETEPEETEPEASEDAQAPDAQTPAKKPDSFLKRMYYSVCNYVSQGYYGMSLSLDEEFTTTYGIGNSKFLMSNFSSLLGIDVAERTYQHKITQQWDENGKWHSFYSYIANDVSFYGVIVVMFLLGLFFGSVCKDVFINDSLIGKLLLPLFIIMFMYMPANNQVFMVMSTCTAFLELTFLWILSKIKWKKG